MIGTRSMSLREAVSLAQGLLKDPSSHVCAAVAGWDRPWPAQAWLLADLVDISLMVHRNPKKPAPALVRRPSDAAAEAQRTQLADRRAAKWRARQAKRQAELTKEVPDA